MPLPENGSAQQWPPLSHNEVYRDMEVNSAWYAGDIDQLETLYATTRLIRRSGLWGQAKRFFFGTPNPGQQGQRPVKLHIPIPSEISRLSSQIMWGEMPKILFEDLDDDGDTTSGETIPSRRRKAANQRLTDLLDDSAHAEFLEAGELASALGGGFLRVTWDQAIVPGHPFITGVPQDAAVPEFRFKRLAAVTFWSNLPIQDDDPAQYRLLERHDPGRIEYGLYRAATKESLGARVPLTDHPATVGIAGIVDAQSGVDTGSELLTAVYVPNVRPVRMLRKDPVASNYGRSDYEALDDLFDAFDEVYTSWMRDIRLAKSRIFVSKDLIDTGDPGQGAYFDADREVYVPVKDKPGALGTGTGSGGGASYVQAEQFKIRYQEHQSTAEEILRQIFIGAGYAPQTFGLQDQHGTRTVTATQVQMQERLTNLTRSAKILYIKPQLQSLVSALMDVDERHFGGPGRDGAIPEVAFPDAAAPSIDAVAQTLQLLRAAEAASTETLVQMLNPDWEPEQVAQEVERIQAETPALASLPDPTSLTGADLAASGPDGVDGFPGDRYSAANGSTGPGVGADPAGIAGGGD